MTLLERRRMLMQRHGEPGERWNYIWTFPTNSEGRSLAVTEGQTLTVNLETTTGNPNLNGWVLYGRGYCPDLGQLRNIGLSGERTLVVTSTGSVIVGSHGTTAFGVRGCTIKIRVS